MIMSRRLYSVFLKSLSLKGGPRDCRKRGPVFSGFEHSDASAFVANQPSGCSDLTKAHLWCDASEALLPLQHACSGNLAMLPAKHRASSRGGHPLRTCPFWSAQSRRNDYAHPRTAMISVV
jgi:hypothetical protein